MVSWRQNLVVVWLSQFLSIMGFAFAMPFAPYFIQELGVTDATSLKLWVSLFAAATPFSLAIAQPLWGAAADRYGRRRMLIRANFAGMFVLLLMGSVRSVETLIILRLLQGAFTGTVTAAQTLVTATTPSDRSGLALGALSAAVFSGTMAGAFLGGLFADAFGFRSAFYAAALLIGAAGLLVLFCAGEDFVPPAAPERADLRPRLPWADLGPAMPILVLIAAMACVRQFDMALVPLLVQDIHGSVDGVARWTGVLFAVSSIGGLLAGPILGQLADRLPPPRIARVCAVAAGLLMIPQGLAHGFLLLNGARFGMMFAAGGLDPVFQIWLAKITPHDRRGVVFGWSSTARSVGWVLAPLASGLVAAVLNIRAIYLVNALLFVLLIPLINLVMSRLATNGGNYTTVSAERSPKR